MIGKLAFARNADGYSALPPGPRLPSSLQAWAWARRPLPFMDRCQKNYGDTFTLRIRHSGTWVVLCNPEDVKLLFTADPRKLAVSEANALLGPLLGRRSVMLLEEPEHMVRRKLMLPPFHGRRMESYGEMMADVARREVRSWPIGEPLELWPRMQDLTLDVVMRVVFGSVENERLRALRELLRRLTGWLNNPRRLATLSVLGPRWIARDPGFRAVRGPVERAVLEEVRRRGSEPDPASQDIVALLSQARYEDGSPLSAEDLRDELITLLLDGPTSTSLAWTFERLLRHPDKLARLRAEIVAGESEAYLEAVISETMRLCPPVPTVARALREPMRLGGYEIPAGTSVAACVYLLHRREDVYPEPERFVPERFLERAPGTYTWIPFGGGVRRCLAASFATQEMKRVLAAVLSEVELRPEASHSERVRRSSIAFAPDEHARAIVVRRRAQASDPSMPSEDERQSACLPAA
jgi:cytochrome P450 family 135